MEARERHDHQDDTERQGPGAGDDDAGAGLESARRAGEEFLSAGDEAIRRALSGDSEQFLRAVRQTGGQ